MVSTQYRLFSSPGCMQCINRGTSYIVHRFSSLRVSQYRSVAVLVASAASLSEERGLHVVDDEVLADALLHEAGKGLVYHKQYYMSCGGLEEAREANGLGYQRINSGRGGVLKGCGIQFKQMNNQEKRKVFEEHLREQERLRELNNDRKKQQESAKNNPQEDMLFIQKEFRSLNQEMQAQTAALKKGQKTLAELFAHYSKMKAYYLQINYVLTTYDRQYYKELLEKTHNNLLELKKKLEPKKKFKFSRRDEDFGVKDTEKAQEFKSVGNSGVQISGLEGKVGEKIVVKECVEGESYKIVGCTNSQIDILVKTEIVFLKNLTGCVIRCAVTKSTVFVDHCKDCKFQLNCHQLRIHNTFDSRFNIFVTSKAIIQDCNRVVFSPYTFNYPDRQRHQQEQDKHDKPNLWRDIQDFNWLKENQKSPHFALEE